MCGAISADFAVAMAGIRRKSPWSCFSTLFYIELLLAQVLLDGFN
jgi:hypothetical protein